MRLYRKYRVEGNSYFFFDGEFIVHSSIVREAKVIGFVKFRRKYRYWLTNREKDAIIHASRQLDGSSGVVVSI